MLFDATRLRLPGLGILQQRFFFVAFFFFIFAIMLAGIFLAPFFIAGFFIPQWPGIGYLQKKTRPLERETG